MHGLILRSFEGFIRYTYGDLLWRDLMQQLDFGFEQFQPIFRYDRAVTKALVDKAAKLLEKSREALLEDFGTFLVTDRRAERVRRLLRFGGVDYPDFLQSLEDLRGRADLAVPDLDLPSIELVELTSDTFQVVCRDVQPDTAYVLLGVLRALADDYGSLAFLEYEGRQNDDEVISIRLLDTQHSEGRSFQLTVGVLP